MGIVIQLDQLRARRDPSGAALVRLDAAVARLDKQVTRRGDRLPERLADELMRIAQAVTSGRARAAADRAERLADLLEHPALGASS